MTSNNDEVDFHIKEDEPPLIPDGYYNVVYSRHSIGRFYGLKLYVWFKIADQGEYFEVEVYRAYNLYKPLPRGSDLFKDLAKIKGSRVRKGARLSLSGFKNKVLKVRTRTVKLDRRQDTLPDHLQYSVIDMIVSVEAGAGTP